MYYTVYELNYTDTCPNCGGQNHKIHRIYETLHNGHRELHECKDCQNIFSETYGTPMQGLKSPISKIASVIRIRKRRTWATSYWQMF